jgi:FkbM family methyltransferase
MIERWIGNLLPRILSKVWLLLPISWRVHIQESSKPFGLLDYNDDQIRMNVNSLTTLARLKSCNKEPETVKWIEDFVKPNDVFYDIGANVGAYSFVARSCAKGKIKVFSFEPGLTTFPVLVSNIVLNNSVDTIVPINIPLSSSTVSTIFAYTQLESGAASHIGVLQQIDKAQNVHFGQLVIVYTLDDFVRMAQIPLPNLIKIDVDGHELEILKGSSKTLRSTDLRSVQVEIDEQNAEMEMSICELLRTAGFSILKKNRHSNSSVVDYIFTKNSLAQSNRQTNVNAH